jgi:hypothetical protein
MGRHRGRPSLNFIGFLAGKCVHVAPRKGPPFLDTRARRRARMRQAKLLQAQTAKSRPLYAFARRRSESPEEARDLVQGFFEHLKGSRGLATEERKQNASANS